ncbi:MAG: hypothetical protein Q9227_005836 [Pyrenula ochraceoflavens]
MPDVAPSAESAGDEALTERLKSALHLSIGTLVDNETLNLGINATPQFIGALTELCYGQIENIAQDLEAFAKHRKGTGKKEGKRRIEVGDVLLLGRRNEGLASILEGEADKVQGKAKGSKGSAEETEQAIQNGTGQKRVRKSNNAVSARTTITASKKKGRNRIFDNSASEDEGPGDRVDMDDNDEQGEDSDQDEDEEMRDFIVNDDESS